jgi:cholesterol oxidase
MFDFRLGRDISVLVGCGLGGTSLINANVALRAKTSKLTSKHWPTEIQAEGERFLDAYYDKAEAMLGSVPYPGPNLKRLDALERAAKEVRGRFHRPKINVTFDPSQSKFVRQRACVLCGDCVTGCNYWAKNTVLMNYLPLAHRRGAQIFTEVAVRSVLRGEDNKWLVSFQALGGGRELFDAPDQFVTADRVVLAAGTLGSTEILLRSRLAGLKLSDRVGRDFSGNGDLLGFAYDIDRPVHGVGMGHRPPPAEELAVGPTITGMIDLSDEHRGDEGILIQDGAMPGVVGSLLPGAFAMAAPAIGSRPPGSPLAALRRRVREAGGLLQGPYSGPLDRSFAYLVMSTDDDHGELSLVDDTLRVRWPGVADRPVFRHDNGAVARATRGLNGTYVPDPIWTGPFGHSLITVHPLGGCVMADTAEKGAVNHLGQVFSSQSGAGAYCDLYVADGSIVPLPLGVNPLLTISALAERICAHMLGVPLGPSVPKPPGHGTS